MEDAASKVERGIVFENSFEGFFFFNFYYFVPNFKLICGEYRISFLF